MEHCRKRAGSVAAPVLWWHRLAGNHSLSAVSLRHKADFPFAIAPASAPAPEISGAGTCSGPKGLANLEPDKPPDLDCITELCGNRSHVFLDRDFGIALHESLFQ